MPLNVRIIFTFFHHIAWRRAPDCFWKARAFALKPSDLSTNNCRQGHAQREHKQTCQFVMCRMHQLQCATYLEVLPPAHHLLDILAPGANGKCVRTSL